MLAWLIGSGIGPALVAVPVNFTADALAGVARRWFRRLRRTDDLSRLVIAATGAAVGLTSDEFDAVRQLLEDQQTWNAAGRGTVEDLAALIESCLPVGDGRTAEDSNAAGLVIARGLLEFAVADLDPKIFQQVLLARLQRMETDQASALDEAILTLHADLVDHLVAQGELDAQRFTSLIRHLRRALDRLPPGPAHRSEIAVYLRTLIDWLSIDPWPQDRRFNAATLTPAAIERKLRVTAGTGANSVSERDADADELARQCQRLVIMGGPGSGKTWLAKRTARLCAEDARKALAEGMSLEEIELPLYTTCAHLFAADGDIREAAVRSALEQLGDLGGSRLSAALRVFFTERNASTVLVIDSLDEAHGSDERLWQADTLPWRILLTSRPSSWNHQLAIKNDDTCRIGELQPLCYPEDVEPFIQRWFEARPQWGRDLAAQIARRPSLQHAATVPLILAFYCIVGGADPLPEFRHDLYAKVLNRVLTGRWRSHNDRQPDLKACLRTLRAWAWSGVDSHPVSCLGAWADDIAAEPAHLDEASENALDHVAAPLGPADVDTGKTLRRVIHWSVREYLVAGYLARLSVNEAVEALLPHIWFDFDWDNAAAAAIAMHPEHDQLLHDLICRVASSNQIPQNLSVIEASWEFRGLLARIASESRESDWSPEMAELISKAQVELVHSGPLRDLTSAKHSALELVRSGRVDDLVGTKFWPRAGHRIRESLLRQLTDPADIRVVSRQVDWLVQLVSTTEDKRQTCDALLRLLAARSGHWEAKDLVDGVIRLASTDEDKRQARDILLKQLVAGRIHSQAQELLNGVVQLSATPGDRRQARDVLFKQLAAAVTDFMAEFTTETLVDGVVQLASTPEDKHQARKQLFMLLTNPTGRGVSAYLVRGLVQLASTTEDKHEVLEQFFSLLINPPESPGVEEPARDGAEDSIRLRSLYISWTTTWPVADLVDGIVQLAPVAEDKHLARDVLLALLPAQTNTWTTKTLVAGLVQLDPTAQDKQQACDVLLAQLTALTYSWNVEDLVRGLVLLDPTTDDKRRARHTLVKLAAEAYSWDAEPLVRGLIELTPTPEDMWLVRKALLELQTRVKGRRYDVAVDTRWLNSTVLRLLLRETDTASAARLAALVALLDPTAEETCHARNALLKLLTPSTDPSLTAELIRRLRDLTTTAQDRSQMRDALLRLLFDRARDWGAGKLVEGVVLLTSAAEDKRQARDALLQFLAGENGGEVAEELIGAVVELAPMARDKRQARAALLELLASPTGHRTATRQIGESVWRGATGGMAAWLVDGVIQLAPTADDKRQARDALLKQFATRNKERLTKELMRGVVQLTLNMADKGQTRKKLLALLISQGGRSVGREIVRGLLQLDPTAEDKLQARNAVLQLLARAKSFTAAENLLDGLLQLDPTAEDKLQARNAVLQLLARAKSFTAAENLLDGLLQLDPTAEDKLQARNAVLQLLARAKSSETAENLLDGLLQLDPTAEDKLQARNTVLQLLARAKSSETAEYLVNGLAYLDPTLHDLSTWPTWAVQPNALLLATVRWNSTLHDWLTALPSLPAPSDKILN